MINVRKKPKNLALDLQTLHESVNFSAFNIMKVKGKFFLKKKQKPICSLSFLSLCAEGRKNSNPFTEYIYVELVCTVFSQTTEIVTSDLAVI